MFTEEEVESLKTNQIRNSGLFTIKCQDQAIRKNLAIIFTNFNLIVAKINQFGQRLHHQQTAIKLNSQLIQQQLKGIKANLLSVQNNHSLWMKQYNAKFCTIDSEIKYGQQELHKLKILFEKREQAITELANKTRVLQTQEERAKKEINKMEEYMAKKLDKSQFQKSRRDIANVQLKLQQLIKSSKQNEVEQLKQANWREQHQAKYEFIFNRIKKLEVLVTESQIRQQNLNIPNEEIQTSFKRESKDVLPPKEQIAKVQLSSSSPQIEQQLHFVANQELKNQVNELVVVQIGEVKKQLSLQFVQLKSWIFQQIKEKSEEESKQEMKELQGIKNPSHNVAVLLNKIQLTEKKLESCTKQLQALEEQFQSNVAARIEQRVKEMHIEILEKHKEFEALLSSKLESKPFQNFASAVQKQLTALRCELGQKAQNQRVKKYQTFLEEKFKEVICIVQDQEEIFKNSLVSKSIPKCLSCDKNIDKLNGLYNEENQLVKKFVDHRLTKSKTGQRNRVIKDYSLKSMSRHQAYIKKS